MLDAPVRRVLAPALDAAAAVLDRLGVRPGRHRRRLAGRGRRLRRAGTGHWTLALVLWLLNRPSTGSTARWRAAAAPPTSAASSTSSPTSASTPASCSPWPIDVPEARLACAGAAHDLLPVRHRLPGPVARCWSGAATGAGRRPLAALRRRPGRGHRDRDRLRRASACCPQHAEPIAWVFAATVAVTALQRVARRRDSCGTRPVDAPRPRPPTLHREPPDASPPGPAWSARPRAVRRARGGCRWRLPRAAAAHDGRAGAADDWDAVLAEADGQTVDWYMYGGDDALNAFVDGEVADRLAELGVTLNQVRITDTADAVNKVLGEQQAGRDRRRLRRRDLGQRRELRHRRAGRPVALRLGRGPAQRAVRRPRRPRRRHRLRRPGRRLRGGLAAGQLGPGLRQRRARRRRRRLRRLAAGLGRGQPGPLHLPGAAGLHRLDGGAHPPLRHASAAPTRSPATFDEAAYDEARRRALWPRLNALEPTPVARRRDLPAEPGRRSRSSTPTARSAPSSPTAPARSARRSPTASSPRPPARPCSSVGNISNVSFVAIPANAADQAGALVLANVLQDPEVQLGALRGRPASTRRSTSTRSTPALQQRVRRTSPPAPSVLTPAELTANAAARARQRLPRPRIEDDWATEVLQR